MKIVDIISQPEHFHYFDECREAIANANDPLIENYINIDFSEYLEFNLLVDDDDEVISFCGMQSKPVFGFNCARIATRTWVNPKYRVKSLLSKNFQNEINRGFHNTRYLLTHQIEQCKKRGLDFCFMSRQYLHKPGGVKLFLSVYDHLGIEYVTDLSQAFSVCGGRPPYDNDGCWQFIVGYPTKFDKETTWKMINNQFSHATVKEILDFKKAQK